MDFALSDEQIAIFDMAKDFGTDNIAPYAQKWDQDGMIPKESVATDRRTGLWRALRQRRKRRHRPI